MIRILDKNVADKIAAGEVIDRPVSIIKELLENSLDADASGITVEIRNGGKSYIRVTDNGCGIEADEAELAFMRHATSKIPSAGDLDAIRTLGFRGEALASICAVARVELITKTADAKTGRKIVIEGSQVMENTAIGCPEGTTVTVRDLFYNVPARQKFLASDSSETRRIVDMVSRISLAYGDVKINMINNGRSVFSTRGNGNILNNIISVYGSDVGRDLLPVESSRDGFLLKGFVSAPSSSAPSRSKQIFCVNGRIVSSKVLEKALEDGYREKLFAGRFPLAFLFLSMPPERLDVNVHPTKKQIRFDDDFEVQDFVREAVKGALNVKEALPQIRMENIRSVKEETFSYKEGGKTEAADAREKSAAAKKELSGRSDKRHSTAEADEFSLKEEQVDIKKLLSNMRREAVKADDAVNETAQDKVQTSGSEARTSAAKVQEYETGAHEPDMQTSETQTADTDISLRPAAPKNRHFDFRELDYMGAVFNTYIIASDESNFYLIDQHAAHERVFYEKLLAEYNREEKLSQQLLIPVSFDVSVNVTATEDAWIADVRDLGYDIEFFGNNTYIVREIPAFMELKEAEDFLRDFFKELEDKPDLTNKATLERIIMRSCKSAVKGGDFLTDREIDALIKDLAGCINPFSCPHGRPTFIRMTKYEIEKLFKRV